MIARNRTHFKKSLKVISGALIALAAILLALNVFFPTYKVQGVSMMPTIQPNSEQNAVKAFGDIERNSIYLIDSSELSTDKVSHPKGPYMKRVAAIPGDTIVFSLKDGSVVSLNGHANKKFRANQFRSFSMTSKKTETLGSTFLNHAFTVSIAGDSYPVYLPDPNAFDTQDKKLNQYTRDFFKFPWLETQSKEETVTIHIPEGQYFVLSDNRVAGTDSRHFGLVPGSAFKHEVSIKKTRNENDAP